LRVAADGIATFERAKRDRSIPEELNQIADVVLAYKPKPKSKAAKKRVRKEKRDAKTA
jgi:hypothetical protein